MLRQTLARLALLIAAAVPAASHAAQPPIYGAYYPGGSAERYPVSHIPADRLTTCSTRSPPSRQGAARWAPKRRQTSPRWPS